jgi:hypothetical protein
MTPDSSVASKSCSEDVEDAMTIEGMALAISGHHFGTAA